LSANKIDRLKKIIVEAIEQSGRQKVPELIILDKLKFGDLEDNENIFFHTLAKDDDTFLKNLKINYDKDINLFI
jgi:16S rRNA U1498 N3-methylase RsmE